MIFFSTIKNEIQTHERKAFTLVEMMIVVGLIGIFTALGVGTGADTNDNVIFFRDQAKVFQAIYQAREYAMATRGGMCGYGVSVEGGVVSIISVPPQAGSCPSSPSSFNTDSSVEGLNVSVSGNFKLVFLAPFGKQYLASGSNSCFTITSPKGRLTSFVDISPIGSPRLHTQTCP